MSEIDSERLFEIESYLLSRAAEKLSEASGKRIEFVPLELKPFEAGAVQSIFTEQPVTVQMGWGGESAGMFLFISKATFSATMPLLSGRSGEWNLNDEQSPEELEQVITTAMSAVEEAFTERTGNTAQFGEPALQIDEGPDVDVLSTFWMTPLEVKIEGLEPHKVMHLLSPALMEAMMASTQGEDVASRSFEEDKVTVSEGSFASITESELGADSGNNLDLLLDVELPIAVELGRVRMMMKEILDLGPGAVVELNKFSGEPVDLFVNNKKFAEGEVVVIDQNFGVRITALVGPNERINAAREGVKQ